MTVEGEDDLIGLRRVGQVVAEARDAMLAAIQPGITTAELDRVGAEVFGLHGARSAPRLAVGFPAATCISVNDEVAHGVPSATRRLRAGDIVNVDVSAELDGYWADTGASTAVGEITPLAERLLQGTRRAQHEALHAARAGRPLRHIGRAVQRCAHRHGLSVVANMCGHGVGRSLHESPSVPNVEVSTDRMLLWEGLVLAIEPILSGGSRRANHGMTVAVEDPDGWTLRTADGSLAAQHEHTVVITKGRPLVLTAS